ncbi:hypothetical protein BLS_006469 [Venturia inaequalis]|uniref:DNA2/NAM7 helicase-like C-terminal domain-containing protein n=1 Tax=Venturia inaequalis TaxID=5025 RepID=A0A8H3UDF4_VENIN|nr:hypothetical protein BLS_006469 [Venturia inaequalis]
MQSNGFISFGASSANSFGAFNTELDVPGATNTPARVKIEPKTAQAYAAQTRQLKADCENELYTANGILMPDYAKGQENFPQPLVDILADMKTPMFTEYYQGDGIPKSNKEFEWATRWERVMIVPHDLMCDQDSRSFANALGELADNNIRGMWNFQGQWASYTIEVSLRETQPSVNDEGVQVEVPKLAYATIWYCGIQREKEAANLRHFFGPEFKDSLTPPDLSRHPGLHKRWSTNGLIGSEFQLIEKDTARQFRPRITGISDERLKLIWDSAYPEDGARKVLVDEVSPYTKGEVILAYLHHGGSHFTLVNGGCPKSEDTAMKFKTMSYDLANVLSKHGNAWFYRLQLPLGIGLQDRNIDLSGIQAPRNCVTKWSFTYNYSKQCGQLTPVEYQPLRYANGVKPDQATAHFMAKLFATREQAHNRAQIKALEDISRYKLHTKELRSVKNCRGLYLVDINMGEAATAANDAACSEEAMKPPGIDTRVSLTVKTAKGNVFLSGAVCDNHFGVSAYFVARVNTDDRRDCDALDTSKGALAVEVLFVDDPTSTEREIAGVEELAQLERKEGYCSPAYLANTKPSTKNPTKKYALAKKVAYSDSIQKRAFRGNRLLKSSLVFAEKAFEPRNGTLLVVGPPGSGKSVAMLLIGEEHVQTLEEKVAFVAPNNAAAEALLEKYVEFPGIADDSFVIHTYAAYDETDYTRAEHFDKLNKDELAARVAGMGIDGKGKPAEGAMDIDGKEQAANELHDVSMKDIGLAKEPEVEVTTEANGSTTYSAATAADGSTTVVPEMTDEERLSKLNEQVLKEAHDDAIYSMVAQEAGVKGIAKHAYGPKFARYVSEWSTASEHPMHKIAYDFLQNKAKLAKKDDLGLKASQVNMIFRRNGTLKSRLEKHFWSKITVLFCTNNAVGNKDIRHNYFPSTVFQDEAGLAGFGTTSIPLAVWKESMTKLIAIGDPKQFKPVSMAGVKNEAAEIGKMSPFEDNLGHAMKQYQNSDYDVVFMKENYRLHEDMGAFLRDNYYHFLEFEKKTGSYGPLQQTIRLLFAKTFGPAYNGRMRVAIDVSGKQFGTEVSVKSDAMSQSTSSRNVAESQVMLAVVKLMLDFDPSKHTDGAGLPQVSTKDIMLVSPYTGQVWQIKSDLRVAQIPLWQLMKLSSTGKLQGTEGPIVILSLVKSDPNNDSQIGFIHQAEQICVELSRASEFLVIIGNFTGFSRAWEKKAWHKDVNTDDNKSKKDKSPQVIKGKRTPKKEWDNLIKDLYLDCKDIIAYSDFCGAVLAPNPKVPHQPTFFESIRPKFRSIGEPIPVDQSAVGKGDAFAERVDKKRKDEVKGGKKGQGSGSSRGGKSGRGKRQKTGTT